ncbi:MAG TPA: RecQ family ATP-dependent DNA helicase [Caldimonas sp.]|nr:RecQ family ATP-dependent DNA helicase [Caldimonas sp.]HEX4234684.1 RecQ family ATP-dependent DNA helicase [Caldimonas sp.]
MPRSRDRRSTSPPRSWRPRLARLLRRTFGLKQLREGQDAVIAHVMAGTPTLAVMPTGAGKSLCYQLPALLLPGTTLVVSPLIALMKDQCDKLRELGVAAVQINSAVDAEELAAAEQAIAAGAAKIVFTTPERLAERSFADLLASHPVSLLVVDEAHCISQWGHDFRPAFLEVGTAAARLGKPTVLALTATASDAVIDDIARQLDVGRFVIVNTGLYRPNLHYRVLPVTNEEDKLQRAIALVGASEGAGLVYTATVKAAEEVYAALCAAGVDAVLYHGRLGAAERHARQEAFMTGRIRVMVATNAFGLGIDRADTRFVIHYQLPGGLDAYYQESGRAGRDGEVAECTLLFFHNDKAVQQFFLAGRYPAREDVADLYVALQHPPTGEAWTLNRLQQAIARPKAKVQVALRLLRHRRVVRQDGDGRLALTRAGLDADTLAGLLQSYQDKREHDRAMLERMIFYGQTGQCRWKVLLENFDAAEGFVSCGTCDNCLRIAAAFATAEREAAGDEERRETAVPPPLPTVGELVRVPRYGRGIVASVSAEGVAVVFQEGSKRVFLPAFVRRSAANRRRQKSARVTASAA